MDLKTQMRIKVLADLIAEQSQIIIQMAEQIGHLNELLQTARQENEALKKTDAGTPDSNTRGQAARERGDAGTEPLPASPAPLV